MHVTEYRRPRLMAIIMFPITHLTERSGRAALRAMQYRLREGQYAPRLHEAVLMPGDTVRYGDFVQAVHGNLPDWALDDPLRFFQAAQAYERGGTKYLGRWATAWTLSLP